MNYRRRNHTLVVLTDGTVFCSGGNFRLEQDLGPLGYDYKRSEILGSGHEHMTSSERDNDQLSSLSLVRFATLCLGLMAACAWMATQDTTYENLAPVFAAKCAPCHSPGGPAPFSLTNYEEARKRAEKIGLMVTSYVMPPCQMKSDVGEFCATPRLTFEEVVAIRSWSGSGALQGKPTSQATRITKGNWRLGQPDLILKGGTTVRAEGGAYWRTFVLDLPPEISHLKAFDILPTSPQVIRHVLIAVAAKARRNQPTIFETWGSLGPQVRNLVGAWAPGYFRWRLPAGVGIPIKGQHSLLVQVQYNPLGRPEKGTFKIGLYASRQAQNETPKWLSIGSKEIDIPAVGRRTIRASHVLAEGIKLLAIHPEARLAARLIRLEAKLADGGTKQVFGGSWDLYWMGAYNFAKPPILPKGTQLNLTIEYTNGLDSMHSSGNPRPIKFGYGPRDELAWVHLQCIPAKKR
ncbi:MAG: hypothetical protein ACR2HJ_06155 [Fimbriimonadales bacterium]